MSKSFGRFIATFCIQIDQMDMPVTALCERCGYRKPHSAGCDCQTDFLRLRKTPAPPPVINATLAISIFSKVQISEG